MFKFKFPYNYRVEAVYKFYDHINAKLANVLQTEKHGLWTNHSQNFSKIRSD